MIKRGCVHFQRLLQKNAIAHLYPLCSKLRKRNPIWHGILALLFWSFRDEQLWQGWCLFFKSRIIFLNWTIYFGCTRSNAFILLTKRKSRAFTSGYKDKLQEQIPCFQSRQMALKDKKERYTQRWDEHRKLLQGPLIILLLFVFYKKVCSRVNTLFLKSAVVIIEINSCNYVEFFSNCLFVSVFHTKGTNICVHKSVAKLFLEFESKFRMIFKWNTVVYKVEIMIGHLSFIRKRFTSIMLMAKLKN